MSENLWSKMTVTTVQGRLDDRGSYKIVDPPEVVTLVAEVAALRAEVARLTRERDILVDIACSLGYAISPRQVMRSGVLLELQERMAQPPNA
jgi:transposase-like protein